MMLRWRSDEAVKIYARMNDDKYADWLKLAATSDISSVRSRTVTALTESLAKAPEPGE
jgi:hypothetical protein